LSYPTLESLVIASVSFPTGVIKRIFWLISLTKVPTHGANVPFNPIKSELGICPSIKSFWFLTSKIIVSLFSESNSKSLTSKGTKFFSKTVSKSS
jgi:hypothetical protein